MRLPLALIVLACLSSHAIAAETPATVKVAAIQFISEFADPTANRKGLEPLIREAAKSGAKIVVLPETAITGYMPTDLKRTWQVGTREISQGLTGVSPRDAAEPVPGSGQKRGDALAA